MWELSVPVTGLSDSEEIIRKAREAGAEQGIKHEDMVKLVLCGEKDVMPRPIRNISERRLVRTGIL
jgi:hypothetical protein